MDEKEALSSKKREVFFPFIITQCICVILILLTLLGTKLFFKNTYIKAKEWYKEHICVDTDIKSVTQGTESGEKDNEI